MVTIKFLGFQTDDHHKQKNHFNQMISKLNGTCCIVMPLFCISSMITINRFAYFYSVTKYRLFSGGHSSNSGKIFALHNKIIRITVGARPISACRSLFNKFRGFAFSIPIHIFITELHCK